MPQVNPTEITTEESQKQLDSQESLQANVLDKIKGGDVFKSLDLPAEENQQQEQAQQQEEEQPEEEQQQEENQDDEEVIPKSKIQPRFDQLTAKLKAQQAEIEALRNQQVTPKDEIQSKLDAMSEETLEETLIQTRIAKEQARDNPENLAELVKLERRIEKQIAIAPQKFVQNQVQEANKTINKLASEGEINESNFSKIQEIAKTIYERYPKMAKQIDGQSMAFELAVEHYKALGKVNTASANTNNLKGQLNNLKKKTALDTKVVKSGGDKVNLDKLRLNAMTGSMKDKERFAQNDSRFKIDAMIPDYLKG